MPGKMLFIKLEGVFSGSWQVEGSAIAQAMSGARLIRHADLAGSFPVCLIPSGAACQLPFDLLSI
jgi:hypothetical protein